MSFCTFPTVKSLQFAFPYERHPIVAVRPTNPNPNVPKLHHIFPAPVSTTSPTNFFFENLKTFLETTATEISAKGNTQWIPLWVAQNATEDVKWQFFGEIRLISYAPHSMKLFYFTPDYSYISSSYIGMIKCFDLFGQVIAVKPNFTNQVLELVFNLMPSPQLDIKPPFVSAQTLASVGKGGYIQMDNFTFKVVYAGHSFLDSARVEAEKELELYKPSFKCPCFPKSQKHLPGDLAYNDGLLLKPHSGPIIECNCDCDCKPATCNNRVFQKDAKCRLQVVTIDDFWSMKTYGGATGIRSLEFIRQGTFIVPFNGELLINNEENKATLIQRLHFVDQKVRFGTMCRYMQQNAKSIVSENWVYHLKGPSHLNVRFSNQFITGNLFSHSCCPNMFVQKIYVERVHEEAFHVGFFALRDIQPFEELTWDYHTGEAFHKELKFKKKNNEPRQPRSAKNGKQQLSK